MTTDDKKALYWTLGVTALIVIIGFVAHSSGWITG